MSRAEGQAELMEGPPISMAPLSTENEKVKQKHTRNAEGQNRTEAETKQEEQSVDDGRMMEHIPVIRTTRITGKHGVLNVVNVPVGKRVEDISESDMKKFVLSGLLQEVEEYTAARAELRKAKASQFQDEESKNEIDAGFPDLVVVAVAGNGEIVASSAGEETVPSPHSRVAIEKLSYFFSRGFGDAIGRCQERGRGIIIVNNAHSTPLVSRLASSLSSWRFSNLRMCGVLEYGKETDKLLDTENYGLERHLQHIVECPEALRGDKYGSTTDVHVLQSRKVQLCETLTDTFKRHQRKQATSGQEARKLEKEQEKNEFENDLELRREELLRVKNNWHYQLAQLRIRYRQMRQRILVKLEGLVWMVVILSLVLVDVVIQLLYPEELALWKVIFDYVVMFTFLGDVVFRMWAMGAKSYFRSSLCTIDFLLSCADIVQLVLNQINQEETTSDLSDSDSGTDSSSVTSIGRTLRMLRFVRLLRLVRVFNSEEMRSLLNKGNKGDGDAEVSVPTVMLVVNGGDSAKVDTLQAVRRQWDIIVLAGTGGLADEIDRAWRLKKTEAGEELDGIDSGVSVAEDFDSALDEIVQFGSLNILNLFQDSVDDITRLLVSRFGGSNDMMSADAGSGVLQTAWKMYGEFSETGRIEEQHYMLMQQFLVFLNVVTSFLLILRAQFMADGKFVDMSLTLMSREGTTIDTCTNFDREEGCAGSWEVAEHHLPVCFQSTDFLLVLVVVLPVIQGVLLATRNKFFHSSKYRTLRGAAEKVKKQIYEYRSRTGVYSNEKFRDSKLSECLLSTSALLTSTEAVTAALVDGNKHEAKWIFTPEGREDALNITHKEDTALNLLEVDDYIAMRLADRQKYFMAQAAYLHKLQAVGNICVYILGGISTSFVIFGLYK
jgi:hypothetical protein